MMNYLSRPGSNRVKNDVIAAVELSVELKSYLFWCGIKYMA